MNTVYNVGLIGTGNIAPAYLRGCGEFAVLRVVACADLNMAAAETFAAQHDLRALSVADLLTDPNIDIVVNLTPPLAHADINLAVIRAGKHVYSEKPLAVVRSDGQSILAAADQAGVRVGCAPDTFLGGGGQTCRKVIEDGLIGQPVAAVAFLASRGPESWHPNPHFFYQRGAGPLFDVGPYYLTALVNLLGPVATVSGSARISFPHRTATSPERFGEIITVEVPTHISATLEFAAGPVATVITSFDVWAHHLPCIEIYGSEGSLSVPDPNRFDGDVTVFRSGEDEWQAVPLSHNPDVARGIGVADMATAIQANRPHRASGALALHVLDVMESIIETGASGQRLPIRTQVDQPAPLPVGLKPGELDA